MHSEGDLEAALEDNSIHMGDVLPTHLPDVDKIIAL